METVDRGRSRKAARPPTSTARVRRRTASSCSGATKTHPESAGELASGLLKMCTIGLGKQVGAQQAHSHGLWDSVRAVPKLQLAKSQNPLRRRRRGKRIPPAVRHRSRPAVLRRVPRSRHAPAPARQDAPRANPVRRARSADRRRAREDNFRRRHGSERHRTVAKLGCAAPARTTAASSCSR